MTKRDVATWFCRVIGLVGLINSFFGCLSNLVIWLTTHNFGSIGYSLSSLILYGFIFLLAQGIGTELAAEGEFGPPISSKVELAALLLRCVGLSLLLTSMVSFSVAVLGLGIDVFGRSASRFPASISLYYKWQAATTFMQSAVGFVLAFGPRLRAALTAK